MVELEVKRLAKKVENTYDMYTLTQDQMKGAVSILYNTPTHQAIIKHQGMIMMIEQGDREWVEEFFETQIANLENHVGYSLNGLRKRREKELNLLFKTI